jgi:hypothetical protein
MRCKTQQGQTCDYSAEWAPEILAMICIARSLALVRLVPTQTSVVGMSIWHTNCLITLSKLWYMVARVLRLFVCIRKLPISKTGREADSTK